MRRFVFVNAALKQCDLLPRLNAQSYERTFVTRAYVHHRALISNFAIKKNEMK